MVKISSTFRVFAFLMAVLTFSRSLITLAQQKPIEAGAEAQAITDAERDVSKMYWFMTGCCLGGFGVVKASGHKASVPAERLIGKSPAYVAAYTSSYQAKQTEIQTKWALRGYAVIPLACLGCVVALASEF